ncbi:helix-turn-helix domain-containing protein [Streptomyces sp. NPDC099050]|uniref:AraC-like ligand-binding domain-containing protein n=1 Tax=Streptomyces sp. NPDC099050 TaxID=3366100 RepID=UPI0038053980
MAVTEFSTGVLPAEDRFPCWFDAASQAHMRSWVRSAHEDDFLASMRVLDLGNVQVSRLSYPSVRVRRTDRQVRQSDPEVYQLNLVLTGTGGVAQSGREAVLSAGTFCLYDSSRPFHGHRSCSPDTPAAVVVQIPKILMPLPARSVARLTAVTFSGHHGMGAVFTRWLTDLVQRADELTRADHPALSNVTLNLLAEVCARHLDTETTAAPEDRQAVLLTQIRDFIQQHLHDPGLTPATIAGAHQISLRQLHRIFDADGMSPAAWIRHQRLEHSRRDLADPRLSRHPLHVIASRWGLPDKSHFSRAFRAAYGISPRDYRQQLTPQPGPWHSSSTTEPDGR